MSLATVFTQHLLPCLTSSRVNARAAIVLMAWKAVDTFDFSHPSGSAFLPFSTVFDEAICKMPRGLLRALGKAR